MEAMAVKVEMEMGSTEAGETTNMPYITQVRSS